MPRRRKPQPDDIRTVILDGALRAFAQRGYDGASMRDIGREAGVPSSLTYHYFQNKQALLIALFERSGALVMAAFANTVNIADPRERLAALLRTSAQIVRDNLEFWRVSYSVRFQHGVLAGLGEGIAAQSAVYNTLFTGLLTELGRAAPEIDARILFGSLDGIFQHYVLDPDAYPLDAVIERLILQFGGPTAGESR